MNLIIKLVMLVLLTFSAIPVMAATVGEGSGPATQLINVVKQAPEVSQANSAIESDDNHKRGLWVLNSIPNELKVLIHILRNGKWSNLSAKLKPGEKAFMSCKTEDYVLLTAVGGWGVKDAPIRQNFKKGSEREVYTAEVKLAGSALLVETK